MHIGFFLKNGIEYAAVCSSIREGATVRKKYTNLGRVIDKSKLVFQSRSRGLFTYNLANNSYGAPPVDAIAPRRQRSHEKLMLDFGDTYLISQFIRKCGLHPCLEAIGYGNPDTLFAMVCYYILCSAGNSHASDWWSGNYASILYAKANLDSQRISDFLTSIGDEYSYREFFKVYLKFVTKEDREGTSILIDSTGLPNSIHFPLTAISNHNGEISNEVRLIYVTHQETGLPIYFRYCPGNVIDTTTLTRTMAELKQSGVNIKFSILDAGYYDIENVTCLYNDGISFVMRLKENTVLYKTMLKEHFDSLACPENFISYNDRYAYMKRVKCELLPACPGYVYIGLDLDRRNSEEGKLFKRAKRAGMKDKDVLEHMEKQGVFMLVSSRPIAKDKILPTYYTRQQIEQIFDIGKNYANMLPLRVQSEDTLRGHLLLTFIASVIVKEMQDRLKKSTYNITSMLLNLRNQKCKVYEKEVVTQEAFKKANDCYKLFKIECPVQIPRAIV